LDGYKSHPYFKPSRQGFLMWHGGTRLFWGLATWTGFCRGAFANLSYCDGADDFLIHQSATSAGFVDALRVGGAPGNGVLRS
jgi:hypothetical protein